MNHNERCKECKATFLRLLEALFGEVRTNYNLRLGSTPDSFEGTKYYSALLEIFSHLQNSRGHQQFVRSGALPNVDFFVVNPGFIVEFDESQHFTEQRMISLKDYPADLSLGYDKAQWIERCKVLHKRDNDPPFRDEQRAWYDTLRDFAPSVLNLRPTVRLYSKARIWCELNPKDPKDVATFEAELSSGRLPSATPDTRELKIGLVSMKLDSKDPSSIADHAKLFLDIVNAHKELDIIVFPGWTLLNEYQLAFVQKRITNTTSLVIFEVWKDTGEGETRHRGYFFKDGILHDSDILQRFSTSKQISGDEQLMKAYLDEITDRRIIEYKGRKICWLICGEINVLRNIQKSNNAVEFRFSDNPNLKKAFQQIFDDIDIFINPTHTIMGNQGKMARRREFLSQHKVFCSVSNADTSRDQTLGSKAAQYLYTNGRALTGRELDKGGGRFVLKEYDV